MAAAAAAASARTAAAAGCLLLHPACVRLRCGAAGGVPSLRRGLTHGAGEPRIEDCIAPVGRVAYGRQARLRCCDRFTRYVCLRHEKARGGRWLLQQRSAEQLLRRTAKPAPCMQRGAQSLLRPAQPALARRAVAGVETRRSHEPSARLNASHCIPKSHHATELTVDRPTTCSTHTWAGLAASVRQYASIASAYARLACCKWDACSTHHRWCAARMAGLRVCACALQSGWETRGSSCECMDACCAARPSRQRSLPAAWMAGLRERTTPRTQAPHV